MGRKIVDLRTPLECTYCVEGLQASSDFLFDPRTSVELRKLEVKSLGAYRHHAHKGTSFLRKGPPRPRKDWDIHHFFEVYQTTGRGLLIILETHHMPDVKAAVEVALNLEAFPTPMDLKLNGF